MIKINGWVIGNKCYPNNERIFEVPPITAFNDEFTIEFKYETDIDISVLYMCKKYLDDTYGNPSVDLLMKYIPYSRMDRKINGYMFSLKYFTNLINSLNFNRVIVLDPHSNVSTALLDRCVELNIKPYLDKIFSKVDIDYVFYPDNGASKRYSELFTYRPHFYGNKERDLQTGKIISYDLVNAPDLQGKDVLIIDDLCATGFTFYNAAQKLKEKGANNIYLYVSHCENSIYQGELLKSGLITKIFTTDSILTDWESSLICDIKK